MAKRYSKNDIEPLINQFMLDSARYLGIVETIDSTDKITVNSNSIESSKKSDLQKKENEKYWKEWHEKEAIEAPLRKARICKILKEIRELEHWGVEEAYRNDRITPWGTVIS